MRWTALGFDVDLCAKLAALGVPDLALGGADIAADLAVLVEEFGATWCRRRSSKRWSARIERWKGVDDCR